MYTHTRGDLFSIVSLVVGGDDKHTPYHYFTSVKYIIIIIIIVTYHTYTMPYCNTGRSLHYKEVLINCNNNKTNKNK